MATVARRPSTACARGSVRACQVDAGHIPRRQAEAGWRRGAWAGIYILAGYFCFPSIQMLDCHPLTHTPTHARVCRLPGMRAVHSLGTTDHERHRDKIFQLRGPQRHFEACVNGWWWHVSVQMPGRSKKYKPTNGKVIFPKARQVTLPEWLTGSPATLVVDQRLVFDRECSNRSGDALV
ncbi:hypothetical protein BJ912DRAFT_1047584 [Pholiota molesta]|nr:hypothetical protein BJ912DRAFT_1047584 [Pholiota molesta]